MRRHSSNLTIAKQSKQPRAPSCSTHHSGFLSITMLLLAIHYANIQSYSRRRHYTVSNFGSEKKTITKDVPQDKTTKSRFSSTGRGRVSGVHGTLISFYLRISNTYMVGALEDLALNWVLLLHDDFIGERQKASFLSYHLTIGWGGEFGINFSRLLAKRITGCSRKPSLAG